MFEPLTGASCREAVVNDASDSGRRLLSVQGAIRCRVSFRVRSGCSWENLGAAECLIFVKARAFRDRP